MLRSAVGFISPSNAALSGLEQPVDLEVVRMTSRDLIATWQEPGQDDDRGTLIVRYDGPQAVKCGIANGIAVRGDFDVTLLIDTRGARSLVDRMLRVGNKEVGWVYASLQHEEPTDFADGTGPLGQQSSPLPSILRLQRVGDVVFATATSNGRQTTMRTRVGDASLWIGVVLRDRAEDWGDATLPHSPPQAIASPRGKRRAAGAR